MRLIYGKHVAPGKQLNWKNEAIMQIEANLINNVWKTRKKIGLQNRKINVKILFIYYAWLHSHLRTLVLCHVRVWHIIRVSRTKGNAVARAFLTCLATCLVFETLRIKKEALVIKMLQTTRWAPATWNRTAMNRSLKFHAQRGYVFFLIGYLKISIPRNSRLLVAVL